MNKIIKYLSILFVALFASAGIWLFFSPKPVLLSDRLFSTAVYDSSHRLLRLTLSPDEKYRLFTPLSQVSRPLIEATLLQEDQLFHWHYGVNPVSFVKAIWQTYLLKSRRVGASTITMQLARLHYGMNSRTIAGKVAQIMRALQIERHYSKDEILEAYLNLAPYGGNIEGAGAASVIYFGSPVSKLNLAQALTLSIIPQNPGKRRPGNQDLQKIRDHLYARWLKKYPQDQDKKMAFDLPVAMQNISNLPFYAPHLVNRILQNSSSAGQGITSYLDMRTQKVLQRITRNYLTRKKTMGVSNAAVLLVDTRDMGIKGLVGSADFFNSTISGQINGAEVKRSPGSALKPFIYALALDQGLIHPGTVLKDVPHSFYGYNPENFDYDFMGPVSARDALILSRNIPAVYLSSQLKNPGLHQLLEQAQVSQLKPESHYGLSMNLGGVEMTMSELVSLYAMLANEGVWSPVRWHQQEPAQASRRLLSPEASFLILDMLEQTPNPFSGATSGNALPVAWKTGTSSGYRDAWAIGVFGSYVMAVWIGNFDNTANPAFIGKEIAAPLLFELIDAIKHERAPVVAVEKNPQRMNLRRVEVCKASGLLPTRYCTEREWTWFIPGKSPITTDTIYREVAISNKTGLRTCHIDDQTRFEVFEFWPSDLLKIFRQAGIQRHTPPFFEADCALSANTGTSPQITSPQAGIRYVVHANSSSPAKIPLSAVTEAGVAQVYWFINETFLAKTTPDTTFFWQAKPGRYVVRVVDDHGLSDARDLLVEMSG